ncbi:hypothetical protein ACFFRR_000018 [Megaselia abdita]
MSFSTDRNDEERPFNTLQRVYTYEEAISSAGTGKFQYFLLLVCGLCAVAGASETVGVSVIMYSAQCDLNFSLQEKGILATASIVGIIFSLYITGYLCDTKGRVLILKWTLLISICFSVISVFSINTWMLISMRFMTGFFIASSLSCVFTYLGEFHGNKTKTTPMTILSSCLVIGILYVNVMAYMVLPLDFTAISQHIQSWRVLLVVYILPSILGFLGLLFLPESPKFLLTMEQHSESQEIFRRVFNINTKKPPGHYPCYNVFLDDSELLHADARGMWKQTIQLFKRERIFQTVNMSIINFTICVIGVGITMWLPSILFYLERNGEKEKSVCSALRNSTPNSDSDICPGDLNIDHFNTLIWISTALLFYYVISSAIVDSLGKKRLLLIWFTLGTFSAFTMFWSEIYVYSIVALTLICQMGKFHGIVLSIAADYYPPNINAMGVCFVTMVSNVGLVVGGNITGALFLNYCDYLFFGVAFIMIIIIILTTMLPKECNGSVVTET